MSTSPLANRSSPGSKAATQSRSNERPSACDNMVRIRAASAGSLSISRIFRHVSDMRMWHSFYSDGRLAGRIRSSQEHLIGQPCRSKDSIENSGLAAAGRGCGLRSVARLWRAMRHKDSNLERRIPRAAPAPDSQFRGDTPLKGSGDKEPSVEAFPSGFRWAD